MTCTHVNFNILNLIRVRYDTIITGCRKYFIVPATPATGSLYVTQNNQEFISGHVRVRGRNNGSYPYNYLEMIDAIFGIEENTIEVCSGNVRKYSDDRRCFTVDINPKTEPNLVEDGQMLSSISNNRFGRWRCDPPYNIKAAKGNYSLHKL